VRLRIEGADSLSLEDGLLHIATPAGSLEIELPRVIFGEELEAGFALQAPTLVGTDVVIPLHLPVNETQLALTASPEPRSPPLQSPDASPSSTGTPTSGRVSASTEAAGQPGRGGWLADSRRLGERSSEPSSLTAPPENPDDVAYSSFLGGGASEQAMGIAVDTSGNAYLTGVTTSPDFPVSPGGYDTTYGGTYDDVFVARVNSLGTGLVYATYVGGAEEDYGYGIAVDLAGNAYVVGATESSEFPVTSGALDTSYNGNRDAFVLKLNPDGTDLIYGTFLGSEHDDVGLDVAVDSSGAATLTGTIYASGTGFPVTTGSFDTTYNGGHSDAFVTRILPDGSGLAYSGYLGGEDADDGLAITLDGDGNAYVAGATWSDLFPVTEGVFDTSLSDSWIWDGDAFIAEVNSDGRALLHASYFGGDGYEWGHAVAVDSSGSPYLAGYTDSPSIPVTAGAFDETYNGSYDAFAARIAVDWSHLEYATYLGGPGYDDARDILVSSLGFAYLTGSASSGFPTTPGAFDTSSDGPNDAFLAILDPQGADLTYGSFLGGTGRDWANSLASDIYGNAYLVGRTESSDFYTTSGALDQTYEGGEAFVTKFLTSLWVPIPDGAAYSCGGTRSGIPDTRGCGLASYEGATGDAGDPIDTRTGNFDYAISDLSIDTSAGPLVFQRSYASLAVGTYTALLGYGWAHNHDTRLIFSDDPGGQPGVVLFKAHNANQYTFEDNGDGTYTPIAGVLASLTPNPGPPITYTLVDPGQATYVFAENGLLQFWSDPQSHVWSYSYDANDRLSRVNADGGQRYLSFTYDAQGRLTSLADHTGRAVAYGYDVAGDLISVSDVLGGTWTYTYDTAHRLTQVTDPRGVVSIRTDYDGQGRAVRQYNGADELIVEITYNPDGTSTIVDARGNPSTDDYDPRRTLTGETDALGGTEARVYDLNFRPTSITDQDGDTTTLAWSSDGANLTQVVDAEGNQTDLTYDSLNNLTEATDPRRFLTTYTYSDTLLTSATDALGNTTSYTFSPEGYLASVTDARGNTTSYTYDAFGQRTSMTDALGKTWTYAYDELGRLVEITDPLGRITHNEYDTAGRLIRTTRNYDPDEDQNGDDEYNTVTEYAYDEVGNQVAVIDTYGRITHYEYDDAGRMIRTTDPAGNESVNDYDEAGNLIATMDALGRTTTFIYDELNRIISTTDPIGNTTTSEYSPDGTLASRTDPMGQTTTYTYDDLKRLVAVTDPMGNTTTPTYDEVGNVAATTDALGRTTTYEYDALNRLIRQTDPLGGAMEHFYDQVGNRLQTIDPNGQATTYAYDALNRLVSVTDALGNSATYGYDSVGNRTRVTDGNGQPTRFYYDDLDRLIYTYDPLGNSTEVSYDALGNVRSRTDANGNTTTFTYDVLNRLVQQTDPLGGETSYAYDAVGNQVSVTDANGNATTTTHDALNRAVSVTDPNSNTSTTTYDAIGNILAASDALGNTTTYAYDALNRQVAFTDPLGNTTEYAYDAVGNRISMTDAEGVVTRYEYDELGRLSAVEENFQGGVASDHETNVRTEYAYDPVGNRLAIEDANGHVTTFFYDDVNRLVSETDPIGNTTDYAYDAVGNRISLTDAEGFTTSFVYDDANRLTTIDYPEPDVDVTFSYDAAGDRVAMTDGLGSTTWGYDALNRATEITDPFNGTVSYAYDPLGNRTSLGYPDGRTVDYTFDAANLLIEVSDWDSQVTIYTYDAANRLETVALPNGVVSTYRYDDAGRLIELRHAAGVVTISSFGYTYDAVGNRLQVVEVMREPGPLPEHYVFLPLVMNGAQAGGPPFAGGEATSTLAPATVDVPSQTETASPTTELTGTPLPPLTQTGTWTPTPSTETATPLVTPTATSTPAPSPTGTADPTYELTPSPPSTSTPFLTGSAGAIGSVRMAPLAQTNTQTRSLLQGSVISRTIDYSYDPLYRLTAADYDDGTFFHYAYDAVGNRLTQETHEATNTYLYDDANRLIEVDGVPYTWDDNGNLLSDGVSDYSYDHANRLSSIVQGPDVYTFAYNGLGDRLQQTVNGDAVDYTLDLNGGLTQVLSDGISAYLYGVGRIAEKQPGGWQYHLGDALGSVRQLADASVNIVLTRSYEPFGDPLLKTGTGSSIYAFAGEQRDGTGLVYLRARYYGPAFGRFLTRDVWEGDPNEPMSFNAWAYVQENPVNLSDPRGEYGVRVHGELTADMAALFGPSHCHGVVCSLVSTHIVQADLNMDSLLHIRLNPIPGLPGAQYHFADQSSAWMDAAAAVASGDPTYMGAALHEVQDWYSHWNEGYRLERGGHALESLNAGCTGFGECRRPLEVMEAFYLEHPEGDVRGSLASRYSSYDVQGISRDKLIDLYLQTFTGPGAFERFWWGYDTDHFFGFTPRDLRASGETGAWLASFFWEPDQCDAMRLLAEYEPPSDSAVLRFLGSQ
jgi:RHS repeat-associated protein